MKTARRPVLVAVVGGSGAGKSWLADRLANYLGGKVARISQDDFYHDRSHLSAARRARINYDHPRAIDWARLEDVLRDCLAGRVAKLPNYDFATHTRHSRETRLEPGRYILVDGLWLLRRRSIRQLFDLTVFVECPAKTRLARRLARDVASRGRTRVSIRERFWATVEPMHARYVAPQSRHAHRVLSPPIGTGAVRQLAEQLAALAGKTGSAPRAWTA